jgi:ElaB/YqjD/DUF883 family membrane-anchored ribosome-binding protein
MDGNEASDIGPELHTFRGIPGSIGFRLTRVGPVTIERELFGRRRSEASGDEPDFLWGVPLLSATRASVRNEVMPQASQYSDQESPEEKATERFENMTDRATDQLKHMTDRASSAAGRVSEQGREAGERVQQVAGNFKGAVDKSVREQPMATLALAAVAGFILGAMWKR